jgi:hypothetical protein
VASLSAMKLEKLGETGGGEIMAMAGDSSQYQPMSGCLRHMKVAGEMA